MLYFSITFAMLFATKSVKCTSILKISNFSMVLFGKFKKSVIFAF